MSATCIRVNVLCTGCMGPTSRVVDHGDVLSATASLIDSIEKEIARLGGRRTSVHSHQRPPHLRPGVTLESPPRTKHLEPNDEHHGRH